MRTAEAIPLRQLSRQAFGQENVVRRWFKRQRDDDRSIELEASGQHLHLLGNWQDRSVRNPGLGPAGDSREPGHRERQQERAPAKRPGARRKKRKISLKGKKVRPQGGVRLDQNHAMLRDERSKDAGIAPEVLLPPKVPHLAGARQAQIRPTGDDRRRSFATIEQAGGHRAVGQRPGPHLEIAVAADPPRGPAERILVDRQHFVIGEQAEREIVQSDEIAASISSGEASSDQSEKWVYCSSALRWVECPCPSHPPTQPTTSMSASFQWPGPA